jgi:hypothetical protein
MSSGLLVAGFLFVCESAERVVARGFITATKRHYCSISERMTGSFRRSTDCDDDELGRGKYAPSVIKSYRALFDKSQRHHDIFVSDNNHGEEESSIG